MRLIHIFGFLGAVSAVVSCFWIFSRYSTRLTVVFRFLAVVRDFFSMFLDFLGFQRRVCASRATLGCTPFLNGYGASGESQGVGSFVSTSTSSATTWTCDSSAPAKTIGSKSGLSGLRAIAGVAPGVVVRLLLALVALDGVALSRLRVGVVAKLNEHGLALPRAHQRARRRDSTSRRESPAPWTCRRPGRRTYPGAGDGAIRPRPIRSRHLRRAGDRRRRRRRP